MKPEFKYINRIIALLLFGLLATGCATGDHQDTSTLALPPGGSVEPALPLDYAVNRTAEGSLWSNSRASLFEDTKANYVGDTVIIDIVENSNSKMGVNTDSSRKSGMDIGVPTISMFGIDSNMGAADGATSLLKTDFTSSFKGAGESDRSGQVTASIAARVTEVLPNGNLSLFGRRAMKVDNEVQYIVVSGIIRPKDISATNRVESTYLADSRIEYYGKGNLADKQIPGWGTRLIENVWPW
jgi:flagellar L-ring protein precursor FlgH